MSVQIVVDMNLPPEWVAALGENGWQAVHWSAVGNPRAEDAEILRWACPGSTVCLTNLRRETTRQIALPSCGQPRCRGCTGAGAR